MHAEALTFDYLIVGGGIVGLATAWRLQRAEPACRVAVVEKEPGVARHQSGHNSGVIHAGVYYPPGSLKARFCRLGVTATMDFCESNDVPFRQCGKLVVATSELEQTRLKALGERARENGLDCEWLDRAAIRAREPAVSGVAALYVPDTGIADYPALCEKLAVQMQEQGGVLALNEEVLSISEHADGVEVETDQRSFSAKYLVVCAGLQADRMARMAGLDVPFSVVPFRGDYYRMPEARSDLVSTLIYPVPDPALPFLGVHLTLTTDGGITIGPTAMLAFAREIYRKWAVSPRDLLDLVTAPGALRLLTRFPAAGMREAVYALNRRTYLRAARRYCPELEPGDLAGHSCGIRAQAVRPNGEMINDFLIEQTGRSLHVCNAPSPAATSAFPIADAIVERVHEARS